MVNMDVDEGDTPTLNLMGARRLVSATANFLMDPTNPEYVESFNSVCAGSHYEYLLNPAPFGEAPSDEDAKSVRDQYGRGDVTEEEYLTAVSLGDVMAVNEKVALGIVLELRDGAVYEDVHATLRAAAASSGDGAAYDAMHVGSPSMIDLAQTLYMLQYDFVCDAVLKLVHARHENVSSRVTVLTNRLICDGMISNLMSGISGCFEVIAARDVSRERRLRMHYVHARRLAQVLFFAVYQTQMLPQDCEMLVELIKLVTSLCGGGSPDACDAELMTVVASLTATLASMLHPKSWLHLPAQREEPFVASSAGNSLGDYYRDSLPAELTSSAQKWSCAPARGACLLAFAALAQASVAKELAQPTTLNALVKGAAAAGAFSYIAQGLIPVLRCSFKLSAHASSHTAVDGEVMYRHLMVRSLAILCNAMSEVACAPATAREGGDARGSAGMVRGRYPIVTNDGDGDSHVDVMRYLTAHVRAYPLMAGDVSDAFLHMSVGLVKEMDARAVTTGDPGSSLQLLEPVLALLAALASAGRAPTVLRLLREMDLSPLALLADGFKSPRRTEASALLIQSLATDPATCADLCCMLKPTSTGDGLSSSAADKYVLLVDTLLRPLHDMSGQALADLLRSSVTDTASVLSCLGALLRAVAGVVASSGSQTTLDGDADADADTSAHVLVIVWSRLETLKFVPGTGSAARADMPKLRVIIERESSVGTYPATEGFLILLEVLLRHGVPTRLRPGPNPGAMPYLEFIIEEVLGKADQRDYYIGACTSDRTLWGADTVSTAPGARLRLYTRALKPFLTVLQWYCVRGIFAERSTFDSGSVARAETDSGTYYPISEGPYPFTDEAVVATRHDFHPDCLAKTAGFTVCAWMLGPSRLQSKIVALLQELSPAVLAAHDLEHLRAICEDARGMLTCMRTSGPWSGLRPSRAGAGADDLSFWGDCTVAVCLALLHETSLRDAALQQCVASAEHTVTVKAMSAGGSVRALSGERAVVADECSIAKALSGALADGRPAVSLVAAHLERAPVHHAIQPSVPELALAIVGYCFRSCSDESSAGWLGLPLEHASTVLSGACGSDTWDALSGTAASEVVPPLGADGEVVILLATADETKAALGSADICPLPWGFSSGAVLGSSEALVSTCMGPPSVGAAKLGCSDVDVSEDIRLGTVSLILDCLSIGTRYGCPGHALLGIRQTSDGAVDVSPDGALTTILATVRDECIAPTLGTDTRPAIGGCPHFVSRCHKLLHVLCSPENELSAVTRTEILRLLHAQRYFSAETVVGLMSALAAVQGLLDREGSALSLVMRCGLHTEATAVRECLAWVFATAADAIVTTGVDGSVGEGGAVDLLHAAGSLTDCLGDGLGHMSPMALVLLQMPIDDGLSAFVPAGLSVALDWPDMSVGPPLPQAVEDAIYAHAAAPSTDTGDADRGLLRPEGGLMAVSVAPFLETLHDSFGASVPPEEAESRVSLYGQLVDCMNVHCAHSRSCALLAAAWAKLARAVCPVVGTESVPLLLLPLLDKLVTGSHAPDESRGRDIRAPRYLVGALAKLVESALPTWPGEDPQCRLLSSCFDALLARAEDADGHHPVQAVHGGMTAGCLVRACYRRGLYMGITTLLSHMSTLSKISGGGYSDYRRLVTSEIGCRANHLVHLLCYDVGAEWTWRDEGGDYDNGVKSAHSAVTDDEEIRLMRLDASCCLHAVLSFLVELRENQLDPLAAGPGGATEALIRNTHSKPAFLLALETLIDRGGIREHLQDLKRQYEVAATRAEGVPTSLLQLVCTTVNVSIVIALCPESVFSVHEAGIWDLLSQLSTARPRAPTQSPSLAHTKGVPALGMPSTSAQQSAATLALRLCRVMVTSTSSHDEGSREAVVFEAEQFIVGQYHHYIDNVLIRGLEEALAAITSGDRTGRTASASALPSSIGSDLESLSEAVAAIETVTLGAANLASPPFMPFKALSAVLVGDLVGLLHTAAAALRAGLWRHVSMPSGMTESLTPVPIGVRGLCHGLLSTAAASQSSESTVFSGFSAHTRGGGAGDADTKTVWTRAEADVFRHLVVIVFATASGLRSLGDIASTGVSGAPSIIRNVDVGMVADAFIAIGKSGIDAAAAEAEAVSGSGPGPGPASSGTLDGDLGDILETAAGDTLRFLEEALRVSVPMRPGQASRLGHKLQTADEFASDTDIYGTMRRIQDMLVEC